MQNVEMKTVTLLAVMRKNRSTHHEVFLKAYEGYRAKIIALFERLLEVARSGAKIERLLDLPEPVDHTDDYDRVISMLEYSVEETVTISQSEFNRYVRDIWEWSAVDTLTKGAYLSR